LSQALLLAGSWKPIVAGGADFDGTNDFMTRGADLSGNADSKSGILSVWLRPAQNAQKHVLYSATTVGGATFRFAFLQDTNMVINGRNAAGTIILNIQTSATPFETAQLNIWKHVLMSWDLAATASHIYIDDVSDKLDTTRTNDTIDYTVADWAVGAAPSGLQKYDGDMAELYFAPGQFLDFSVESNRRKFITATKKPMYLGSDGSTPTGVAPLIYQSIVVGGTVSGFATNKGGGGNFSITGTLDAASTSPSG
jgi:hypothetical protein